MGRAADVPPRKAAASRLPVLDGRRHRRVGRDRREGLPLRRERARAVHRSLARGGSAREARSAPADARRSSGRCRSGRSVAAARPARGRRPPSSATRSTSRRTPAASSPSTAAPGARAGSCPCRGRPGGRRSSSTACSSRATAAATFARSTSPGAARRALWSIRLGGCIESTPAVWRGRIYVGTRGGALYALTSR